MLERSHEYSGDVARSILLGAGRPTSPAPSTRIAASELSRAKRLILVAMLGTMILGACSDDTGSGNTDIPRALGPIVRVASDYDIRLPLDAYYFTPFQSAVYQNALARRISACMAEKGFDFEPPARPTAGLGPTNARRYGMTSLDHARRYGYQPVPRSEAEAHAIQRSAELDRGLSKEGVLALTGGMKVSDVNEPRPTVGAGCYGEAVGALRSADLDRNRSFVDRLQNESYNRSMADPRVQEASKRWSACMAEAGFEYEEPLDPNNQGWQRPELPEGIFVDQVTVLPPDSREVIVATKDAECNQAANVAGIWMAVEAAYQRQLIDKHQQELDRIKSDLAQLLRTLEIDVRATVG